MIIWIFFPQLPKTGNATQTKSTCFEINQRIKSKSKNQSTQLLKIKESNKSKLPLTLRLTTKLVGVLLLESLWINWTESCWYTQEVNRLLLLWPIRDLPAMPTMLQLSHWRLFWPIGGLSAIVSQWESRWSPIGQNFRKYVNFLSICPSSGQLIHSHSKRRTPTILLLLFR